MYPPVHSIQKDQFAVSIGPNIKTTARIDDFVTLFDYISEKTGYTCLFTPFYPMYDKPFSSMIRKKMKHSAGLIETRLPPDEMYALLSECRFGVGMRLHFMIFLSLLNKPIWPILYDKKVVTFAEMLQLSYVIEWNNSKQEWEQTANDFIHHLSKNTNYTPITSLLSEMHTQNKEDLQQFISSL
jgi:polysaccharide pyruvyl transferase WcaK-like protein